MVSLIWLAGSVSEFGSNFGIVPPGGEDEGGGEELGLLLDRHVDRLHRFPGGVVPHHHTVAVPDTRNQLK